MTDTSIRALADALFKQQIEESLNNAMSNCGYSILDWSAEQLAADMVEFDSGFEEHEPEQLVPFVKAWLEVERAKLHALQLAYPPRSADIYGADAP